VRAVLFLLAPRRSLRSATARSAVKAGIEAIKRLAVPAGTLL
jgi:hypothetical protein